MNKIFKFFKRTSFVNALRYSLLHICRKFLYPDAKISFSEFSEDLLITTYFKFRETGTYVDVGCNFPITNSVTFQLYMKGWSGINIDGNADLIESYGSLRPKDRSVCELIDETVREVEFIKFRESKLNTINPSHIFEWNKDQVIGKEKRVTKRLSTVLESFWPEGMKIDFLTIDVEGMDLAVLKSHDFNKYPVKLVVIEMHGFEIMNAQKDPIYEYLVSNGYSLMSFSGLNGYFHKDFK